MPVSQYVYFALFSTRTSAAEMTEWLGLEPDEFKVRGSRLASPPVPVQHSWKVDCREPGLQVDEQISRVLARLHPHTGRIAELAERLRAEDGEPEGGAVLQVVRYFNDEHKPLGVMGWHLDRDVLDFMAATGAVLDVDEYDLSD